jgi:hypothetical protein
MAGGDSPLPAALVCLAEATWFALPLWALTALGEIQSRRNSQTVKAPGGSFQLCEPQSPFPGNGILPAETKAPERRLRFGMALGRDDARTRKPANSSLFAMNWEISVCARLRGGPGRPHIDPGSH